MDMSQSCKKQQNKLSRKMPKNHLQRQNIFFLTATEKGLFCLYSHKKSSVSCAEIFKVVKGLEPKIFSDLLLLKEPNHYSLKHAFCFKIPTNKTVCNDFESISY